MEFLEKIIQNERTGANITGVSVDTSTQRLINNPYLQGFNELEKIAKEMDSVKLKNKKTEFELNLEKMELDFSEKWNDPNIYRDTEKYNEMLKDRNNLHTEKIKMLADNKYFSLDEKNILRQELDNRNKSVVLGYYKNRNVEQLKETIDETNANIEQLIEIGQKKLVPTDFNGISEYIKKIADNYSSLKNPTGMSDKELEIAIGKKSKILINGIYQEHLNNIISNPSMTLDKKEVELQKLALSMENKEYKEKLATELTNMISTKEDTEQTKNFFISSFENETKSIINQYRSQFNEIKRNREKERKIAEREFKHQQKIKLEIDKLKNPENYTEVNKAFKKVYGRNITINDIKESRVNYDWEHLSDFSNTDKVSIFKKDDIGNVKRAVDEAIKSGLSYEEANNLVYQKAIELVGENPAKVKTFIKQYSQSGGVDISPVALYYGSNNPNLYKAEKIMKNKNGIENNINIEENLPNSWFGESDKEKYQKAIKNITNDPIRQNEIAKRYISYRAKEEGKTIGDNKILIRKYAKEISTEQGQEILKSIMQLQSLKGKKNHITSNNKNFEAKVIKGKSNKMNWD